MGKTHTYHKTQNKYFNTPKTVSKGACKISDKDNPNVYVHLTIIYDAMSARLTGSCFYQCIC
jgi:hypothetical protein